MKDLTIVGNVPAKKEGDKEITKALSATIIVHFPENLKEAKEMFGPEACLSNMQKAWTVTLQSNIRSRLKKGVTAEALAKELAEAKMGVANVGASIDPQAAFIAKFKLATPEGQAKMIAELKTAAAE